jgi:hypothetical protein
MEVFSELNSRASFRGSRLPKLPSILRYIRASIEKVNLDPVFLFLPTTTINYLPTYQRLLQTDSALFISLVIIKSMNRSGSECGGLESGLPRQELGT